VTSSEYPQTLQSTNGEVGRSPRRSCAREREEQKEVNDWLAIMMWQNSNSWNGLEDATLHVHCIHEQTMTLTRYESIEFTVINVDMIYLAKTQ